MRIAPARDQFLHRDIPGRGGVLRQQADTARHLFAGKALDLLAVEIHAALNRRHQAAEGSQQGRFTAAVRADNRRKMAVRDSHRQVTGNDFFAIAEG